MLVSSVPCKTCSSCLLAASSRFNVSSTSACSWDCGQEKDHPEPVPVGCPPTAMPMSLSEYKQGSPSPSPLCTLLTFRWDCSLTRWKESSSSFFSRSTSPWACLATVTCLVTSAFWGWQQVLSSRPGQVPMPGGWLQTHLSQQVGVVLHQLAVLLLQLAVPLLICLRPPCRAQGQVSSGCTPWPSAALPRPPPHSRSLSGSSVLSPCPPAASSAPPAPCAGTRCHPVPAASGAAARPALPPAH